MSRKHTQALKALVQSVPAFAGVKTQVTRVPNGTAVPYVVIHPANGANTADRFTGPSLTQHPRYTLHVVGVDADQVQLLMDLLEAAVFPNGRGVLAVPGERVQGFWYASPLPIQADDDVLPGVVFGVVECGWTAA